MSTEVTNQALTSPNAQANGTATQPSQQQPPEYRGYQYPQLHQQNAPAPAPQYTGSNPPSVPPAGASATPGYQRSYPSGYYPEQYNNYYQQQPSQTQLQTGGQDAPQQSSAGGSYSNTYYNPLSVQQRQYYKTPSPAANSIPYDYSRYGYVQGYHVYNNGSTATTAPTTTAAPSSVPVSTNPSASTNVGQVQPVGLRPRVTTTSWEDEKTLCYQVDANGVTVVRRQDNNMINGTKLLNVAHMTRGRRDGILKSEKTRHVVKIGSMHLKGVWIPFESALILASKEGIVDALYPLFVRDIERVIQQGATVGGTNPATPTAPANGTGSSLANGTSALLPRDSGTATTPALWNSSYQPQSQQEEVSTTSSAPTIAASSTTGTSATNPGPPPAPHAAAQGYYNNSQYPGYNNYYQYNAYYQQQGQPAPQASQTLPPQLQGQPPAAHYNSYYSGLNPNSSHHLPGVNHSSSLTLPGASHGDYHLKEESK